MAGLDRGQWPKSHVVGQGGSREAGEFRIKTLKALLGSGQVSWRKCWELHQRLLSVGCARRYEGQLV